jgi:hypothetical protein
MMTRKGVQAGRNPATQRRKKWKACSMVVPNRPNARDYDERRREGTADGYACQNSDRAKRSAYVHTPTKTNRKYKKRWHRAGEVGLKEEGSGPQTDMRVRSSIERLHNYGPSSTGVWRFFPISSHGEVVQHELNGTTGWIAYHYSY